jgi:hypothetical protein
MQETPTPLTKEQVELLRNIVAERAPGLAATAEAIVDGSALSRAQIEELVDVLDGALLEEDAAEASPGAGKTSTT